MTQHFRSGQNPAAQGGCCRTCPHLSPAKDTSLQFPPSSPPFSSNHGHLNPLPSPGVPFPERGFEQRRDVRPLDVQIRRSAFRHLLPLAVAETAATAAARPRALWEWRPAAPPSRQVETKRDTGGGGRVCTGLGPGGGGVHCRGLLPSTGPCSSSISLRPLPWGPPGFKSPRWGLGPVSLQRCHCPVRSRLLPSPASLPQAPGNPCLRIHSRSRDGEGWGWEAWGQLRFGRNANSSGTGRCVASHRTRARCGPNKEQSETERLAAVPFLGPVPAGGGELSSRRPGSCAAVKAASRPWANAV